MPSMVPRHAADILNRVGLVVGFLSFWFAAPEFIGEERLKSWEGTLAKWVGRLPTFLTIAFLVTILLTFGFAIRNGWKAGRILSEPPFTLVVILDVILAALSFLEKRVNKYVLSLVNDQRSRQHALAFGAVLFSVSFFLQLIATYPY